MPFLCVFGSLGRNVLAVCMCVYMYVCEGLNLFLHYIQFYILKFSNSFFHAFFFLSELLFIQLFIKILSGRANSVDTDQAAPDDLGLHSLLYALWILHYLQVG